MNNLQTFWWWINERHHIYNLRDQGQAAPWTKDKILQSYRFCNVFRELDTVTEWIRINWRDRYEDHENLWFAMCVARQINRIETLDKLGFPTGDLTAYVKRCRRVLSEMRENGEQIYGAAYILTAGGKAMQKHLYTCDYILAPIAKNPPDFTCTTKGISLRSMWEQFREYEGFGPFIAYEVVTDLRWTRYYHDKTDHMTWANAGPGAKRGLSRIYFGSTKHKINDEECLRKMRELLTMSRTGVLKNYVPSLEMRDIEHSLCEVDKYLRVKNGEGRPKAKYDGSGR